MQKSKTATVSDELKKELIHIVTCRICLDEADDGIMSKCRSVF
jgi:hypothetical protein